MEHDTLPTAPRALASDVVRSRRARRIREPHVEPINHLIDRIAHETGNSRLPYLDPTFGGVEAELLYVLKAPEADADPDRDGVRFLSLDNDDVGAAIMFESAASNGIRRERCAAWNICPFPIVGSNPSSWELQQSVPYHVELVKLLSRLRVVVLLGRPARDGWSSRRFGVPRDVAVVAGASSARPGIYTPANRQSFESAMRRAAELLT